MKYLHLTLRPVDNQCNLYCKYCSIQAQYNRKSFSFQANKLSLLEWFPSLLKQLTLVRDLQGITFAWHGGEPLLLPKSLWMEITQFQSHYLKHIRYHNFIQTNGLLLTEETAKLFIKTGFDITISIDGPRYKHNKARCRDKEIFIKILNNIYTLKNCNIPFSLCMVIHESNCKDAKDIMDFILEFNPKNGVTFPPRFNGIGSMLAPQRFGDFLVQLFDLWWPDCSISIGLFDSIILGLKGKVPDVCFLSGGCENFLSIDSQGNIFSTCWLMNQTTMVGSFSTSPSKFLYCHKNKIHELQRARKKKSLFELLGSKIPYIYFQSKGCIYRMLLCKGKDPYASVFTSLIRYISRRCME